MTDLKILRVVLLMSEVFRLTSQIEADIACVFLPDPLYHGVLADCRNRNLKDIPKNLPPNTTSVNLSFNKIGTIRNNTFEGLSHLKSLVLKNNDITHLESVAFQGCHLLEHLDLFSNKLNMTPSSLPDPVFDTLHNLQWLDLKSNQIRNQGFYPERIFRELQNLEVLRIDVFGEPHFGKETEDLINLKKLVLGELSCTLNILRNGSFLPLANTSLELLDIAGCRFELFETGTFAPLSRLQVLLMGYTDIGIKGAFKSFSSFAGRTMRMIDLFKIRNKIHHSGKESIKESVLDEKDMRHLSPICVEKINIAHCGLLYIDILPLLNTKFSECVTNIDLSINRFMIDPLEFIAVYMTFGNLTFLDISFQEHGTNRHLPSQSMAGMQEEQFELDSYSSKLLTLMTEESNYTITMPKNLLYINTSALTSSLGNINGNLHLINAALLEVNVSFMGIHNMNAHISGLGNLVSLDISGNQDLILIDSATDGFSSVKTFHANYFSLRQDAVLLQGKRLLQPLHQLESFHLANNHLSNLPNDIFANNVHLKQLDLSGNVFRSIPFDLKSTTQLKVLDMTFNSIGLLDTRDQKMIDRHSERIGYQFKLLLNGNVFRCDCPSLHFLFWLIDTRTLIDNRKNFTCLLENDDISNTAKETANIQRLWRKCIGLNLFYICSFLTTFMILSVLSVLLVKTNITTVRCMIEKLIRKQIPKPKRGDFRFDLYIAYADHDYQHVCHDMCSALEDKGLKLFIWDRDSIPGDSIADQIAENICHSWKILLNFTANFENDPWTYMSMMVAINSVDNNNPERVILLLPEEERPGIPNCLLDVLPESCIIRTPNSNIDNNELWDTIATLVWKEIR